MNGYVLIPIFIALLKAAPYLFGSAVVVWAVVVTRNWRHWGSQKRFGVTLLTVVFLGTIGFLFSLEYFQTLLLGGLVSR